jgi:hypothetical protein
VSPSRAVLVALGIAVALMAGTFAQATNGVWPHAGAAAANIGILLLALWLALPAIGGAAAVLLFAGPTIWWIDKPTLDVAAFGLVVVGMSNVKNVVRALALVAAAIIPFYKQPLHFPSFAELIAVPFDPAIGLVSNFPWLALAIAIAVLSQFRQRDAWSIDQTAALVAGGVFLMAISQAANLHGATPGPSRYINWLIPLAIPFVRHRTPRLLAGASAIVCVVLFHPATPLFAREPGTVARYLWSQHPSWNNPLPEVFGEMMHRGEDRPAPAATPACEKLLIAGTEKGAVFPVPCYPADAPPACAAPGALCYANRDGGGYRFAAAPGSASRHQGFTLLPRFAWPAGSSSKLRGVLDEWQWATLRPKSEDANVLREIHGVRVVELETQGRLVLILRQATPGARLAFRPRSNTTAVLVDGATGDTLRSLEFNDAPLSRWEIDVPSEYELLLLSLKSS